jgi:AcrR family transcriptional regulator
MGAVAKIRPPRQDTRHNRRRQLLDAAAELFCRHGFPASIRDIARAVGMLPGSVYYHFPSKDALLLAVYEEGVHRVADHVDAAVAAESDPWTRLEAACRAHLEMVLDRSAYAQVVIRILPRDAPAVRGSLVGLRDAYETRFTALVTDLPLPAEVDRRHLRLVLVGAMNWSQTWYRPGGDPPAVIAARLVALLRPLGARGR